MPFTDPHICDICGKPVYNWCSGEAPIKHEACWAVACWRSLVETAAELRKELDMPVSESFRKGKT
jgi:hypothetical protein